jgi:hypothetical protein
MNKINVFFISVKMSGFAGGIQDTHAIFAGNIGLPVTRAWRQA